MSGEFMVGHLASVMFCLPLGVQAEPYRIRVYCLGSDAAVAGLLAIKAFISYYQYCPLQFIPRDDGIDGDSM